MRYLVIIVLLVAVVDLSGQQIVYGEYFFDTKRNYGEGASIPLSGNSSLVDLDFTVNTANLEDGLHTLFVRFQDSDNKWTQTLHFPVFIRHAQIIQIQRGEYFFDESVDYGSGAPLNLMATGSMASVIESITVSDLPNGWHRLFVRFQDTDGKWGMTFSYPVWVKHDDMQVISGGEYFFNEQVAYGMGTPLNVSDLQETTTVSQVIDAPAALPPGSHLLFYRFRNNQGQWSQTFTENVCLNVVSGTYSLDANQYCFDEVVGFLYSSTNASNASYAWDLDDDGNFNDHNSTGENFTYIPLVIGSDTTIFRYHISSGLCPDWSKVDTLSTVISSEIMIQVQEVNPEINSAMNGSIAVNTSGGIAPYTYQWFLEDNIVATMEDISSLSAGNYTLLITDANDCTAMVEVVVDNLVNSSSVTERISFSVFPNPSSSYVMVKFGKVPAEDGWIQLINSQGQEVMSKKWENGTKETPLDLSNFSAGCYYLTYRSSESTYYHQINRVF